MSDGVRPPLIEVTEEAYLEVLRTMQAQGIFGDKSILTLVEEQPPIFTQPRRCSMPDFASNSSCKWPMLDVTYSQKLSLPGLNAAQIVAAYQAACESWNRICGIRLQLTPHFDAANIYAQSGKIDGRSGTLAWSYLPCGSTRSSRMQQLYDDGEAWSFDWLVEVAAHEVGHAIGLSHGPKGSLMYAYSAGGRLNGPQAWDIEEARARYGLPDNPTPAPQPPTPGAPLDVSAVVVVNGVPYSLVRG